MAVSAFRSARVHCLSDPDNGGDSYQYFEDGILLVRDGRIDAIGDASKMLPGLSADISVEDYSDSLIVPGLVDCHVHYPQTDIIASYGEQLLD